jgi:hypothetical protein
MTATMSSRQRMLAAIKLDGPDHLPFSPYIGQGPWWPEPLLWRDQVERAHKMLKLGLDPTIDIWLPDPQPHPDVQVKTWREQHGTEILLGKEYLTPAGVLRQVVQETRDWCDPIHGPWIPTTWGVEKRDHFGIDLFDDWNISRRLEPWVKGREDLDKLRHIIRPIEGTALDEWRMDAQRARHVANELDLLTVARRTVVGDAFQWFCDIPWFTMQLYDDPQFVDEFLDIFQEWSLHQVDLALETGADVVQYRGWYESPMFWGPAGWKKHLAPLIQGQAARVHAAGKLHSYLNPEGQGVYGSALKTIDSDVLQMVDPRMLHRGTLTDLFAQLGDSKAFWGGVNAEVVLESQDPAKIDKGVRLAVEALGQRGGLILSAYIFPEMTPTQSIMYMIEAWKHHCLK